MHKAASGFVFKNACLTSELKFALGFALGFASPVESYRRKFVTAGIGKAAYRGGA
ncbi:hypothetical protein ABIB85_008460 [Bradyrhizobium sp. JR1.5]